MKNVKWASFVRQFPLEVIRSRIPGLPDPTIYAWQSGHRSPPEWQKSLITNALGDPPESSGTEEKKRYPGRPRIVLKNPD